MSMHVPSSSRTRARWALLAALTSVAAAAPVQAQTALTSGAFTYFDFGGVGSGADQQPFTFASDTPFYVTVVDGFIAGDEFQLFAGSTLIGATTAVPLNEGIRCETGAACLEDSGFSRGTFFLSAGSYEFNILTVASPFGSGGAFIGANVSETLAGTPASVVPEPGTWALLGTGLLALGGISTRRRRQG